LSNLRLRVVPATPSESLEAPMDAEPRPRGEFLSAGAMRGCFEENGFDVDEIGRSHFRIHRDGNPPIDLKVRYDRLDLRMEIANEEILRDPAIAEKLLELNGAIAPVAFAVERSEDGTRRLVLLETRDGRDLTRLELIEIVRAMGSAAAKSRSVFG